MSRKDAHAAPISAIAHRDAGLANFESGDFAAAQRSLLAAVRAGMHDRDIVALVASLLAENDGTLAVASFYREVVDRYGTIVRPERSLEWAIGRYDAIRMDPAAHEPSEQEGAALDLLTGAAEAGSWEAVIDRRADLESILSSPAQRLDLLEQLVYAPESTGLPAAAAAEIEALGHRAAAQGDRKQARSAERLLHGIRQPWAAYRVEDARRRASSTSTEVSSDDARSSGEFDGLTVLIAGGHPPLRRMVSIDFKRSGATGVREVPSKWEAVQSGRSVQDRVAGSDLAVLIGRQLAHSTADQVRTAAERYGVPLARAETAGVGAIRRAALGARR